MEDQKDLSLSPDKKEGLVEKVRDTVRKITDRRLKDQFQRGPRRRHFDPEEEIDDSLDESEYDEDDPLGDF